MDLSGDVWFNAKASVYYCTQAAARADAASRSLVDRSVTVTTTALSTASAVRTLRKSALPVRPPIQTFINLYVMYVFPVCSFHIYSLLLFTKYYKRSDK